MNSTPGGPAGEEKAGRYRPIRYAYSGAMMRVLLREFGEPVVVDMRAIETLPVVVDAVD